MKRIIWLPILLVCIIFVSGCIGQYGQYGQPTTPVPPAPTEVVQLTGELKEFTIEGFEYEFSPGSITVNKGDRVKVIFKNAGTVGHSFVIEYLGVSTRVISPGSTDSIEFTADRSGTFTFYCSVPGHRPAGMEGHISIS